MGQLLPLVTQRTNAAELSETTGRGTRLLPGQPLHAEAHQSSGSKVHFGRVSFSRAGS